MGGNRALSFVLNCICENVLRNQRQEKSIFLIAFAGGTRNGAVEGFATRRFPATSLDPVFHLAVIECNVASGLVGCSNRQCGCHQRQSKSKMGGKAVTQKSLSCFRNIPSSEMLNEASVEFLHVHAQEIQSHSNTRDQLAADTQSVKLDSEIEISYGEKEREEDRAETPFSIFCCDRVCLSAEGVNMCPNPSHRILRFTSWATNGLPNCSECGSNSDLKVAFFRLLQSLNIF